MISFEPQHGRVGFIGLGAMGHGMAHCLLRRGWRLDVFARRAEAAQSLVAAGARATSSPSELGRGCTLVFLSLSDAQAVEEVLFGDQGLAASLQGGSVVVDTSTISAQSARAIGARLEKLGVWLLDAPVSGGQQGAEAGTLACMVGGPAEVLDACRDVMNAFSKTITHIGPLGSGQTVKSCNQVAVAANLLGVIEAIELARAQGVDPNVMREVILGGTGRSFSMEKQAPRIIEGDFKPGFRAELMRKDLRIALESGVELPVARRAERLLDELCESGQGDADWSAIGRR